MSPRARKAALVLAAAVAVSIVGASVLIGLLGGNWLVFLALAFLLCVTCLAAFVMLASWTASMGAASDAAEDRTPPRPDDRAVARGAGRVWDPDVTEVLERYSDRDRWAS